MPKLCEVCATNEFKYRCPKCRVVYCSVGCYKAHECKPRPAQPKPVEPVKQDATPPSAGLVQPSHVSNIRQDKQLMDCLSNSRLQELMRSIDSAKNRERALDNALETNPEFKAVMERMLEVGGWSAEDR